MTDPRIIVALDCDNSEQAVRLAKSFSPGICRLKVGLELYTAAGPDVIGKLMDLGFDVFLDLKFHDIPNTVARACKVAAEMGVWMVNVHTLGSESMLIAAREAIESSGHKPLLLGVTILTSHAPTDLIKVALPESPGLLVKKLASLAKACGLDGVVCSPQEVSEMRAQFAQDFVLVTPGIRPEGASADDQRRFMTPKEALAQGSDYLVIGRPITGSADPGARLREIAADLQSVSS